jgi:hypothetical protein
VLADFDNLYMNRGVPYPVINQPHAEDYLDYIVATEHVVGDKTVVTSAAKQRRMLAKTLKNPLESGYTFVIAGKTDDKLAKTAAFEIFKSAFRHSTTQQSPYWHNVYGSYKDPLRDDEHFKQYELGPTSLLVINNIAINSTNIKLEKVRDIYEMFTKVPKVLVVVGEDPYAFCAKYLFIPVTRCIYFE